MSALSRSRGVNVRREDSKRIEDETRKMEAKLDILRKTMDSAREESSSKPGSADGRWSSGSASKPLTRGYVKGVLEVPKPKNRTQKPSGGGKVGSGSATPEHAQEGAVSDFLVGAGSAGPSVAPQPAQGGAASNLQAALVQQNEESSEVEAFLCGLKLDRYVGIFFEHGFDGMEVVQEMTESHMREIGMAVGHVVKLQKKLGEMRPQPAAPPPAPAKTALAMDSGTRRVSFGATEEVAARKAQASASVSASTNLNAGQFDEGESAASFQEALRAWREGRDVEAEKPPAKAGSFWSTVGGDEVNLERCSTPVQPPAASVSDSQTQRDLCPSEEKLCCYQCYKQFYKQFAVEGCSPLGDKRLLCSEVCADLWVQAMEEKMQAQKKRQEKMEALREAQRALELQQFHGGEAVEAN